jgi:hypothetical protein
MEAPTVGRNYRVSPKKLDTVSFHERKSYKSYRNELKHSERTNLDFDI